MRTIRRPAVPAALAALLLVVERGLLSTDHEPPPWPSAFEHVACHTG